MTKSHRVEIKFGDVYGLLTVVGIVGRSSRGAIVHCVCECGTEKDLHIYDLRSGNTKSCGCHKTRVNSTKGITHGLTGSSEYISWSNMIARTTNPKHPNYKEYGGRGISIDRRWLKFDNFLEDMGNKPTPKHTIERIKNHLGYSKINCEWATRDQQSRNTRRNVYLTFGNTTKLACDWARDFGVSQSTLHYWTSRGYTEEQILCKIKKNKTS